MNLRCSVCPRYYNEGKVGDPCPHMSAYVWLSETHRRCTGTLVAVEEEKPTEVVVEARDSSDWAMDLARTVLEASEAENGSLDPAYLARSYRNLWDKIFRDIHDLANHMDFPIDGTPEGEAARAQVHTFLKRLGETYA